MNLVSFRQTVKDGVWSAPSRHVKGNEWKIVQNLHKFPRDKTRGYVMGIQKMRRFIDGMRTFDKPIWKTIIRSQKVDGVMIYDLICTRIERR